MIINGVESNRGKALIDALCIINGERRDRHGDPEDSFKTIAGFWAVYLSDRDGSEINAHDVAVMQALMKIARIKSGVFHEDSYADCAGYIALASDMRREQSEVNEMLSHYDSICDEDIEVQDHEGEFAGECPDGGLQYSMDEILKFFESDNENVILDDELDVSGVPEMKPLTIEEIHDAYNDVTSHLLSCIANERTNINVPIEKYMEITELIKKLEVKISTMV